MPSALNVVLFVIIPKGFFPEQDTGRLMGGLQADQSISFQAMQTKLTQMVRIVQHDPAVDTRGRVHRVRAAAAATNTGQCVHRVEAARRSGRRSTTVMTGLRRALAVVPGARLFLMPIQDIRVGGRQSNAAYQYTLQATARGDL